MSERWEWVLAHAAAVDDVTAATGARWEGYTTTNTFLPCASPSAVLWGPAERQLDWQQQARQSLVRSSADQALADVLSNGMVGTRASTSGWGWLPTVLSVTLSDRPAVSHCAAMAAMVLGPSGP